MDSVVEVPANEAIAVARSNSDPQNLFQIIGTHWSQVRGCAQQQ
jgi:hypothetical protein